MDKKGFAIVSTFRRLEYLSWGRMRIYTHHRKLIYIFEPEAYVSSVPKTAAQQLENWKTVLYGPSQAPNEVTVALMTPMDLCKCFDDSRSLGLKDLT